jgi:hypothetical protein
MNPLLKEIRHNPLLWLLAFVPVVFAAQKLKPEAHTLLFVLSVLAIVPLAALPWWLKSRPPSERTETTGLTPEESSELDHFMQLEHVMREAVRRHWVAAHGPHRCLVATGSPTESQVDPARVQRLEEFALSPDAGEEVGGAFVGAVLPAGEVGLGRHQLPAERLGQHRLGERVHPLPGRRIRAPEARPQ